jgi:hypothetical protein
VLRTTTVFVVRLLCKTATNKHYETSTCIGCKTAKNKPSVFVVRLLSFSCQFVASQVQFYFSSQYRFSFISVLFQFYFSFIHQARTSPLYFSFISVPRFSFISVTCNWVLQLLLLAQFQRNRLSPSSDCLPSSEKQIVVLRPDELLLLAIVAQFRETDCLPSFREIERRKQIKYNTKQITYNTHE